jgi:transposase
MRHPVQITESQRDEIQNYLRNASSKEEFQRLQCVWLRALGLDKAKIPSATALSPISVAIFQSRFFRGGISALLTKAKGGRFHQNMSIEEEGDLLHEFLEKAKAGQILVVSELKEAYELALGRRVPNSTVYRVLARHGWRKLAPRPRHPQSDEKVQQDFKKTSGNNISSSPGAES